MSPLTLFNSLPLIHPSDIDTTKIIRGGRRFNASTKAPTADSRGGASSLWTETPAERQQRLADEVAGKRRRIENSDPEATRGEDLERAKRRKAEEDVRRGVDEHTVSHLSHVRMLRPVNSS